MNNEKNYEIGKQMIKDAYHVGKTIVKTVATPFALPTAARNSGNFSADAALVGSAVVGMEVAHLIGCIMYTIPTDNEVSGKYLAVAGLTPIVTNGLSAWYEHSRKKVEHNRVRVEEDSLEDRVND